MKIFLIMLAALAAPISILQAQTVRVLVWDEQQAQQAAAYENFLGNEIAARLDASSDTFEVRSASRSDGPHT